MLCCFFSVFFCFSSKFTSAFFFIFSELMLCKLSQCLINSVWIRAKIQNKRQMQTFKKITIIKVLLTRIVFKRIDNTHFLCVCVCVWTHIYFLHLRNYPILFGSDTPWYLSGYRRQQWRAICCAPLSRCRLVAAGSHLRLPAISLLTRCHGTVRVRRLAQSIDCCNTNFSLTLLSHGIR